MVTSLLSIYVEYARDRIVGTSFQNRRSASAGRVRFEHNIPLYFYTRGSGKNCMSIQISEMDMFNVYHGTSGVPPQSTFHLIKGDEGIACRCYITYSPEIPAAKLHIM